MKKIALILAVGFPLATGMALTSAFALGVLPLLSTDPCYIAKDGTAIPPSLTRTKHWPRADPDCDAKGKNNEAKVHRIAGGI